MNDKLKQIADYYGIEIQSVKLAEECAEYSAAGIKALYYMTLSEVNCSAVFSTAPRCSIATPYMQSI